MLIDQFLPEYDFSERHETNVRVRSAARVYAAVNTVNLADSRVIKSLLTLRGLGSRQTVKTLTLRDMTKEGFAILGEEPNREILLGLAGKFWSPSGCLQEITAENFRAFDRKGFAKAAWNFVLTETDRGEINLATETRVQCLDAKSLASFRFYWRLIKPFSGWMRNEMLKLVKQKAEKEEVEND